MSFFASLSSARWPHVLAGLLAAALLGLTVLLLLPVPGRPKHNGIMPDIAPLHAAPQAAGPAEPEGVAAPGIAIASFGPAPEEEKITLAAAPDSAVTENAKEGALPVIAGDGRRPWQIYARPFKPGKWPQATVVVGPIGGDRIAANAAIEHLPPAVTLAIDAAAPDVAIWLERARQAGHETILALPAEPFDYPQSDPGPGLLLTGMAETENLGRLRALLAKGAGYIGITIITGTRFVSTPKALEPVAVELNQRGLAMFDAKPTERSVTMDIAERHKLPIAAADFRVTADLAPEIIDQILVQAARQAQQAGHAVVMVAATPLAIDRINDWALGLRGMGVRIAPLSAELE